jgi:CP family cyanate transporter-like MFS transporter
VTSFAPHTPGSPRGRLLVVAAIILLAANLRVAVGSLGVVLEHVRSDLGMSATVGGIVATIPVLCFALFGTTSARLVRRFGLHTCTIVILFLMAVGLAARPFVDSQAAFIALSVVALAGAAVGNVILPPLVKAHFPDKIATVSSLYGAALMGGAAFSSTLTVPLSDALGGWRPALAAWAILAVVTLAPWLVVTRRDARAATPVLVTAGGHISVAATLRSKVTWAMLLVFGAQSAGAYAQFGWFAEILTDAGVGQGYAGALLGMISGVGIPLTLSLPWLIGWTSGTPYLPWAFASVTAAGWLGVLLSPASVPWLWALLLGLGGGAFTWTLTMIAHKTSTPAGTAALSTATQGLGYTFAALGPFGVGALHDATGSWTVPIIALMALAALIAVFGTIVSRSPTLEQSLATRSAIQS